MLNPIYSNPPEDQSGLWRRFLPASLGDHILPIAHCFNYFFLLFGYFFGVVCSFSTKRRHLLKRIEEPMKQFESNQNVLAGKDAKRIIKVGGTNAHLDVK